MSEIIIVIAKEKKKTKKIKIHNRTLTTTNERRAKQIGDLKEEATKQRICEAAKRPETVATHRIFLFLLLLAAFVAWLLLLLGQALCSLLRVNLLVPEIYVLYN